MASTFFKIGFTKKIILLSFEQKTVCLNLFEKIKINKTKCWANFNLL